MKKQPNFLRSILAVGVVTMLLLLVPLVAMQFTDEVDWSPADFIIIGILLFSAGFSYVLISRHSPGTVYRAGAGLAIGTTLLMTWANLAVGLIGAGPNAGNLMYIGIVGVVIIGTVLSRFTPKGMERAMFSTSGALALLAVIALAAGMHRYPHSSEGEIIAVNAFFAALFALSGLLFRYAALKRPPADRTAPGR